MLAPIVTHDHPSSSPLPSPFSSPYESQELLEESSRLQLQLKKSKELLLEKSRQLINKSEELIACRSSHVGEYGPSGGA